MFEWMCTNSDLSKGYDAVVLQLAIDLQLLNQWAAAQYQKKSAAELAKARNADPVLVGKLYAIIRGPDSYLQDT